ncbi:hypothetical protein CSB07_00550 [Candidatus Gracilibacteria bacterium]|nr:MAG: hypothetical protein CSB07_00550 [Candidatus Gracilibacteria bacterium]PIE85619.1 MAG: hypothetical protein CSA08_01015 [Candidatus Gracilibacteria bacterium]
MKISDYLKKKNGEAYLKVKVITGASKTEFFDLLGNDIVKLRLTAIPEKGKANEQLIKFLSKELKIRKNDIEIISGKTGRLKELKIKYN